MFDHFTFAAAGRADSCSCDTISPLDTTTPSIPIRSQFSHLESSAPSPFNDLASQLDDLSPLHSDDISLSYLYSGYTPTPAAHNNALAIVGEDYISDRPKSAPSSPAVSRHPRPRTCRRLQRQLNTQLLGTRAQHKAISALVEEMVEARSQCAVVDSLSTTSQLSTMTVPESSLSSSPSSSRPPSEPLPHVLAPAPLADTHNVPDIDEGFYDALDPDDDDLDAMMLSLRRATEYSGLRRSGPNPMFGATVFSRPRMRKKICRRKRAGDVV
jgi:hypothetical protein